MDANQEAAVLNMYGNMREEWPMEPEEYKRHLLNHISYSHAYLSGASVELAEVNAVALCEAAMHAAACAWCIADYHNEASPPDSIPAEAWEGIANRWIKAVDKWSKGLKSNAAAAYQAPIRERAALKDLPLPSGAKRGEPSSSAAPSGGSTPESGATVTRKSGGRSSVPITASGKASASDAATRTGRAALGRPLQSRNKKPAPADV